MFPRIVNAEYIDGYTIHITFDNGTEGEVDLEQELYGRIFIPLKDLEYFKDFSIDPDFHTLTWKNGADFAPEFLYDKVQDTVNTCNL